MSGRKLRLATVWLDGCSGCHMSFLDLDERLIELAQKVAYVYGPLADASEFPENVDITLVEGGLGSEEDLELLRKVRQRSRILVALGQCALKAHISSIRNRFPINEFMERIYPPRPTGDDRQWPDDGVPPLLPRARPLHEVVPVDVSVPGCPPSADAIHFVLKELLEGRIPDTKTILRMNR
ncbi:MAG: NADP oxidoreductase [Bacillota bacterium]|nr:MAG: NADP oxidoreductase [Bacillota bacterium]